MQKPHDNSKASPAALFLQDNTLIAVIQLGLSNWLVAGLIPGVSREPLKKLEPNPEDLLKLLHGWRDEAIKAGRPITLIAVAYETGAIASGWLAGCGTRQRPRHRRHQRGRIPRTSAS